MAAVIKIEIQTAGGVQEVKRDIADLGKTADAAGGGFSSLQEIATGALRRIGESAINLAGTALSTLGSAVADGIADAKANAIIQAQTAAVLKSTGDAAGVSAEHIADYASALSDAAGKSLFGDDQIQQSTNLLLTFTNIKGKVLDAATAISVDMAQALGGAPKDAAIQLGKALNDPVAGITALTRVGVSFTEQQKEQIKAMQEAGNVAGAQQIILDELNKEFGGSAAAAAAATGGWSEFNGRLGEAKEAIGAALLPVLNQLAGFLLSDVMPAIENLTTWFAENLPGAIATTVAFWNGQLRPAIETVYNFVKANMLPILAMLATVFLTVVVPAFIAWATAATAAAIATIAALAPVLLPIAAIGAAVAVLKMAWDSNFLGIRDIITSFWEGTGKPIFDTLKTWLTVTLTAALSTLADFWTNVLQPALNKVWSFISGSIIPLFQALAGVYIALLKKEVELLAALWSNVLWPALQRVWTFIVDNIAPAIKTLVDVHIAAFKHGVELLSPVLSALSDNILKPMATWFNNIGDAIAGVIDWLDEMIDKINSISVPDWLKGQSPPPMADWFNYIGQSIQGVNVQLPILQANLAPTIAPMAIPASVASSSATTNNRSFNFSVTNHGGPSHEPIDYAMARSLAGI